MALFKKTYEENRVYRWLITSLLIVCLLVGIACVRFYMQVQGTVREESEHYLKEISSRISSNVKQIINDNFSVLQTFKSILENNENSSFEDISTFLKVQVNTWEFTNILLIDDGGVAYDLEGKKVSISGDSFLRTLSIEEDVIAPTQIINSEEKTVFSTPLQNVQIDGKKIEAIATMYDPEQFDKNLSMHAFDKKAFAYIVNKKGNVVVRSTSDASSSFGYNAIQTLVDQNPNKSKEIEALRSNMKKDNVGQLDVVVDGVEQYLVYSPIGLEDWYLFSFVPVSVVNAKSSLLLESTIIMTGIVFFVFSLFLIVIVKSFRTHRKKLEQIAYVDTLTKGHTRQRFYDIVEKLLEDNTMKYTLVYSNIQRFKVLNDQFGRDNCDKIIANIHDAILHDLTQSECIAHYGADNFIVLIKYQNKENLLARLSLWEKENERLNKENLDIALVFTLEFGIYIVEDKNISIEDMIDRAQLAIRNGSLAHKEEDHVRFAFYNESVRHQLIKDKHLEDMMESALRNNEFKMYLQPKYITATKKIGGAEALVRWESKKDGMIYPNDFIPLFEKNGFIIKLDLWMFEQACDLLQSWYDNKQTMVSISINCSRVHLQNYEFLNAYIEIFKRYHFPAHYLELEFTENMVFEDTQRLAKVIDEIHEVGFGCSMDDFGSGYSSLNLLQDIQVDTIKLDRIFFKNTFSQSERTRAIISCILEMAQSLKMQTVAEGIEDWEQVDVLKSMGCDLIQGYVYAKPMPKDEFEVLFHGNENIKCGDHNEVENEAK